MNGFSFDVYGLRARVSGWERPAEALRLDFAWFEAAGAEERPDVEITLNEGEPDFDDLGSNVASFITPRNVVYQTAAGTVIDYFGRALAVLARPDAGGARLTVTGTDEHLVHEAAYHYLMSRAGEHLDARGLPRLHALALAGEGGAVAVLLPSGGGKSTLAMRALRTDGVRLISEDTPLLDRRGYLHPYPLRIGINATDADRLDADQVRRVERMEFHPKLALEVEAFANRIEAAPQPLRHLVVGQRSLGRDAALEPVPARQAVGPLLREAVVGVGVYQGMEFVLQRGMRDTLGMLPTAAIRARCSAAALRRASVWRLTLGRDHERNWAALEPLLVSE